MSSTRWWMAVAAIGCAGLALARPARAGDLSDVEVNYTIKAPDPNNPKAKGDAPQIEATIIGAPNLAADKFTLVDKSVQPPVRIKASSRRAFNQGPDKVAYAIVMLGWEMWIGNDTYLKKDDPTRVTGVLNPLRAALDKVGFKTAGPPGSVGMVITYDSAARVRVPMGPLEKLGGSALGTQKDYKGVMGFELVKGVELALAELRKVTHPRKVLIVITDGQDTESDKAKAALAQLRKQAQSDRVQTFALVYKAPDSGRDNVMVHMTQHVSTLTSTDGLAGAMQTIMQRLADRQYLTFSGFDKAAKTGLSWDGKVHELAIAIDKDETEPVQVVLAPKWAPPGGAGGAGGAGARPVPAPAPAGR